MEGGAAWEDECWGEKEKEKMWEEESCSYKGWAFPRSLSLNSGRHTYVCRIQRTPRKLDGDTRKSNKAT